jgi:hypothetical protein
MVAASSNHGEDRQMKRGMRNVAIAGLLLVSAGVGAQGTSEPLSGLPLAPGMKRTGDAIQTYRFCGKSASIALYLADFPDLDHEVAWYTRAMPGAAVFTANTGIRTFISKDGTAAVEAADAFVSYFRFSPGLSPAQMKILGAEPAARDCTAD